MRLMYMKNGWTTGFLVCMLSFCGRGTLAAQTSKTAQKTTTTPTAAKAPAGPSTLSGIYTNEQASRGKDVYAGNCKMCHTASSHTGETFAKWWRGKQLSDLFTFVSTRMPKNNPGSLADEDVADVMAYLLKMNAMPVGPGELPPDVDSLKKFRIEMKRSGATSTAKRAKP
jgi:mono/diheme cytochrome c family protein